MRSKSFFGRACVAFVAIAAAALVAFQILHTVEASNMPYLPSTLLARASAPGDGTPTTHPIPAVATIPPVPSTFLTRLSTASHTPKHLTNLLPPRIHNFTRPILTNSNVSRADTSDPHPSSKSIIGMSIALAIILTLLICTVLGLLIHSLRKRRARAHDDDAKAPAMPRGVPPMARMPSEMGSATVPQVVPLPSESPLAADLREVRMNQVVPRMVEGRDVEMVNREEPESRRRGWQEECDRRRRGGMGRFTEEGMEDVDLGEGGEGRGGERKERTGGWGWGLAAGAAV